MSLQRFIFPACCFAIGILFGGWGLRFTAPASAEQKQPATDARSAAALLEAAKAVYQGHTERMKIRSEGVRDLEYLCHWSRRWLDAERAIDKAKDKQVAAYSAHLDRMKALEGIWQKVIKDGGAAKYELAVLVFYRIEAEQWLAEAKGR